MTFAGTRDPDTGERCGYCTLQVVWSQVFEHVSVLPSCVIEPGPQEPPVWWHVSGSHPLSHTTVTPRSVRVVVDVFVHEKDAVTV